MIDNHDTPLEERLAVATVHIMADNRIVKRLRYTMALLKINQQPSTRQAEMLAMDIIPYLDKQGAMIDISDAELAAFQLLLLEKAWNSGTLEGNFRTLQLAKEKTK